MAGFPCSAIFALYLTAITFFEGAAMSANRASVQAATASRSNVSLEQAKTPTLIPPQNRHSTTQKDVDNGQQDDNPEDSEIIRLRIEMIKAQILQKLQMDKAPVLKKKAKDRKIADLLLNLNLIGGNDEEGELQESDDENYAKITKIIVFCEKAKVPPSRSKRNFSRKLNFQFKIDQKSLPSSVSSAFLWVHSRKSKHSDLNGKILHIEAHDMASHRGAAEIPVSRAMKTKLKQKKSNSGWVKIDVKDIVQHWFNKTTQQYESSNATDGGVHAIEISCLDCDSNTSHFISSRGRFRPLLVIDLRKPRTISRKKRNGQLECDDIQPHCCRRSLYVNFTKIGWDWIIMPKGFHANYCEGTCEAQVPQSGYSFVFQQMRKRKLTPHTCCTPSKMSDLSILYNGFDELIMKTDVPDMRVDACSCS